MDQEHAQFIPATLDPLKFLGRLPEFSGDKKDLYTFISLVDRIEPLFVRYDDLSQLLFFDLIKSKCNGKAKEAIEINFYAQTWSEIRTVLINYFGENQSVEQLYDNLRSTIFKTNTIGFYNDINDKLRSLNNKTVSDLGININSEQIARTNMRTALDVFREKIPEPMKTILACRNPDSLEEAMNILFISGYANYEVSDRKNPFENGNKNKSYINGRNSRSNQNFSRYYNSNGHNVNRQNDMNHRSNLSNHISGQNRNNNYPNYHPNPVQRQLPEPMDINMIRNSSIPNNTSRISSQCNMPINTKDQPNKNFCNQSIPFCNQNFSNNMNYPNCTNHTDSVGNINMTSGNANTENFLFLASQESYHI